MPTSKGLIHCTHLDSTLDHTIDDLFYHRLAQFEEDLFNQHTCWLVGYSPKPAKEELQTRLSYWVMVPVTSSESTQVVRWRVLVEMGTRTGELKLGSIWGAIVVKVRMVWWEFWWRTPRLLSFLLTIPSVANQIKHCPPSPLTPITPLPSPTKSHIKSELSHILWLKVYCCWSDHFHIDTFMITLICFRPPALPLLSFHFIFLTHSLWPWTYLSVAQPALPLISSHFVITIWPLLFTPYHNLFRSTCQDFHVLFLDTPNSSHNVHFLLFHLTLGILALVDTFGHASSENRCT